MQEMSQQPAFGWRMCAVAMRDVRNDMRSGPRLGKSLEVVTAYTTNRWRLGATSRIPGKGLGFKSAAS